MTYVPLLSFQMLGLTKGPLGTTAEFLNKAMDPPHPLTVQNAIELLVDIGAFDQGVCMYIIYGGGYLGNTGNGWIERVLV